MNEVQLSIGGRDTLKEQDFEELTSDSFVDYEISSISGSDDEDNADVDGSSRCFGETEVIEKLVEVAQAEATKHAAGVAASLRSTFEANQRGGLSTFSREEELKREKGSGRGSTAKWHRETQVKCSCCSSSSV
ncbi:hypothetical protein MLD38_010462 [Melastoma candidum]|uniref:Uncharacterized protein n=1 Tax=Melastoma candidum TaxID=119954 RepID=A0ACB9R411_9MYRT|nr:hypothetical protein MLD38_010462 [Melastoma candidum]